MLTKSPRRLEDDHQSCSSLAMSAASTSSLHCHLTTGLIACSRTAVVNYCLPLCLAYATQTSKPHLVSAHIAATNSDSCNDHLGMDLKFPGCRDDFSAQEAVAASKHQRSPLLFAKLSSWCMH